MLGVGGVLADHPELNSGKQVLLLIPKCLVSAGGGRRWTWKPALRRSAAEAATKRVQPQMDTDRHGFYRRKRSKRRGKGMAAKGMDGRITAEAQRGGSGNQTSSTTDGHG